MQPYKYLLLDADNTLFDFNRAEKTAFYAAFSASGLYASETLYRRYHEINDGLWKKLERGEVTRERLIDQRFETLFCEFRLGDVAKSHAVSRQYLEQLACQRFLLESAVMVCRTLSMHYSLYIITNGDTTIQRSRFDGCGLEEYISDIYISEQLGAAKPSPLFFTKVMQMIGDADPTHYLVVGDSLTSDIDGADTVHMDAVWLDHAGNRDTRGREVSYIIRNIRELLPLLMKDYMQ